MVKVGAFTLELVNAETEEPFKEHVSSNLQTYVEVEPGIQYWVGLKSDVGNVAVVVEIDGRDLGYRWKLHEVNQDSSLIGLWSVRNGRSVQSALKFERAPVCPSGPKISMPEFWTGKVTASFHQAIEVDVRELCKDFESSWQPGDVSHSVGRSDLRHKMGVKTGMGTKMRDIGEIKSCSFECGKKLGSITVNYCSALGLIHAGILPKPPGWNFWDEARIQCPRKRGGDDATAPLVVNKKQIRTTREDDGAVLHTQGYEEIDLT